MWRVVHFLEEDTVAAVPLQWVLNENACRWPTLTGIKLRTAISKCLEPDESWPIHECRLLGEIYGDLSTARMKAIQAEVESDLNSDAEAGFGRRKLIKNRKYDNDSFHELRGHIKKNGITDTSESEEEIPEIRGSPEMPTMNTSRCLKLGSNKIKDAIIECRTPVSSISEETRSLDIPIQITEEMPTTAPSVVIKEADPTRVFAEETFRRQVLRQLATINFKMDQLAEDVARLSSQNHNNYEELIEESIFDKFDFPLKNMEELRKLEKYLEIGDNKTKMVCELSKMGGANHKAMAKRLLERLIANVLAMNYSWLGFKKKDNFSGLILSKVVIESVLKIHRKNTESDVELAIKSWLVKAKEREEKSHK